ncbi:MAG TPA: ABC transporter permease [Terracidiphilus sp.]|nr:ABC transporter permease [Terracidiphilus sp.]
MKSHPGNPAAKHSVDPEIAHHIDLLTQDFLAQGLSPEQARRRALIEFGGREQVRQSVRAVHASAIVEAFAFHARAAWRFLCKSPAFSLTVILTLALAIGANSAVFSAIDAVVLRPLPFPEGDRLAVLYQHDIQGRNANRFVAPVRLEDWNRLNSTFQSISGYYTDDLSELSGSLPEKVTEVLVAPRFFQVLGVSPVLGRTFTPQEEHWGGPNAALISYRFWQRRFHGDPAAIGAKLHVGGYMYPIVGIMPASFQFPDRDADLYSPSTPDAPFAQRRDSTWFTVIGRLKPGVSIHQANADLIAVQARLGRQFAKPDSQLTVQVVPMKDVIVGGGVRSSLWLVYGSVTLLLLIACSNIAALLLARTAEREHEISLRYSLGAPRSAIIAQLLAEVFALALLGALAGLLVAAAAAHGFHLLARSLPRAEEIVLNARVMLYSLCAALATTFLCGLFPALRGTRRTLARALASGSRTQVSTRNPLQWALVAVQVTLAVTLLVGAGLLLRSLDEIARVYLGFDPSHVLTFQVSGSWGETADMKTLSLHTDRILESLRTLPGVVEAATSDSLPGLAWHYQIEYKFDGNRQPGNPMLADGRSVSAGYFRTVQIPIVAGQGCKPQSTTADALVNRSFVDRYVNGQDAVGHHLSSAEGASSFSLGGTIVGIVADAREEGANIPPVPTVYSCLSAPTPFPNYLVRTQGDPAQMGETIRRRIHEIDPNRSVYAITPLQQHLDDASLENRLRTTLLSLFAATAVALACIGIYGTLSYLGRLRRREVGVRLALGAQRSRIVRRFLAQGLRVTLIGCIVGLILGRSLSYFLAGMLYSVSALDPATYAGVVCLILAVAALASLVPALRAARTDPIKVLRDE